MRKILFTLTMLIILSAFSAQAEIVLANDRNGVPGMKMSLNDSRIRRSGNEVVLKIIMEQTGSRNIGNVCFSNDLPVWVDDEEGTAYLPNALTDIPADGDPISRDIELRNVSLGASKLSKLKVIGRAPDSPKVSGQNSYGDFDYAFTNLPLPNFCVKTVEGLGCKGAFTDSDFDISFLPAEVVGNDIKVSFVLTNKGRSDKTLKSEEGYATTMEGDRVVTTVRVPESVASGEDVNGYIIIPNAAKEKYKTVKHKFYLTEKGYYYRPELMLW